MRDYILIYINGQRYEIQGEKAFITLANYLRNECHLTGTKVVCQEGDCGACSVLVGSPNNGKLDFVSVNSCLGMVGLFDGSHIITVEGLKDAENLNPIQQKLVEHHGTQCGYCTSGVVVSLSALFETKQNKISEKNIRNALTGNLCRCTGYQTIIDSALAVDGKNVIPLNNKYGRSNIVEDLSKHQKIPISITTQQREFFSPTTLREAIRFKKTNRDALIFSSATDLGVRLNKGSLTPQKILSLKNISELYKIEKNSDEIVVGSRVTLSKIQDFVGADFPEFERFLNIFASPQIKNTATLVGNIANASPVGDTIIFLMAIEGQLEIAGVNGKRRVSISEFYKGYKSINLKSDEIITRVFLPLIKQDHALKLYKVTKRKDLDISCVNAAFILFFSKTGDIEKARVAYGGVAPTVIRLKGVEAKLRGQHLSQIDGDAIAGDIQNEINPISDMRGTASYRNILVGNLFKKFLFELENEV